MTRTSVRWLMVWVAVAAVAGGVSADDASDRDPVKEAAIEAELRAIAPDAVATFSAATVAMDVEQYAAAEVDFRRVTEAAPDFDAAWRRLGIVIVRQGRTHEGVELIEKAVAMRRSAANVFTLGYALAFPGDDHEVEPESLGRAASLVDEAIELEPGDGDYWAVKGQLALMRDDLATLRTVVSHMSTAHPEHMGTHWLAAVRAAIDEEWTLAEREIREAGRLGLPDDAVEEFLAMGVGSRAAAWRWARWIGIASLAWVAGLLTLFVVGKLLSALTLRSVERDDPNCAVSGATRQLRSVYRTVVTVAGFYWYVSLPFVALFVIAATAAMFYGFFMVGRIPIKLAAVLGIGALVTVYALVRSLFVRVRDDDDPGRAVTESDAPGLWTMAREVASEVGTRPVDEIWMTTGTELAVFERGTMRDRLRDTTRRALVLGAGVIDGFDQNAFRAVLAHEYGHFSHRDTAGGDVALRVQNGMFKFAVALAQAGYAVWWNVAFQFLRLYDFLYRRISHGAIRLQEVLADRIAIQRYGLDAFKEGLTHVVNRSIVFEQLANQELGNAIQAHRAVSNLYTLPLPADPETASALSDQVRAALEAATTEDDTHPSPKDRFRLGERVRCVGRTFAGGPVWTLFKDPRALKHEMHEQILDRVEEDYDIVREGRERQELGPAIAR